MSDVVKKCGLKAIMPSLEFEGPMGIFWDTEDVPIEAIAYAIKELFEVAQRRGYSENFIFTLIKNQVANKIAKESKKE